MLPLSVHCYRIQPLHMFIVCLTTGPLSMVPRGPFSTPFTHLYHDCKDSWWANILLISNFFQIGDMVSPSFSSDLVYHSLVHFYTYLNIFPLNLFSVHPMVVVSVSGLPVLLDHTLDCHPLQAVCPSTMIN